MKKFTVIGMVTIFALFSFISCGKGSSTSKPGAAKAEDAIKLLPEDAQAVFLVDLQRAMSIEAVDKAIKENKSYSQYQEFVEKSGMDPQKDINFVAIALTSGMENDDREGVGIVNLNYNKEALIAVINAKAEEEGQELLEEDYNGISIYSVKKEEKEGGFAFLDNSNIAIGNKEGVQAVIDVYQKKKDNLFKNKALSDIIAKTNKDALLWGAIKFTPEAVTKMTSGNPMLSNLDSVQAATIYLDYLNKNIIAEIKIMSSDEAKNQQIVQLLNGLKAMGAMASAEKPEIGELMDKLEITSGSDHVKIYASLPEELVNKLKEEKKTEEEEE